MNKKGQALIEFILILPVVIMIVLALFDFVNIFSTKSALVDEVDSFIISEESSNVIVKNDTLIAEKEIDITSFLLYPVFGKKYKVSYSRVIHE